MLTTMNTSHYSSCKEAGWTKCWCEGNLILLQYNLFERWAGWGEIAAVLDFRRYWRGVVGDTQQWSSKSAGGACTCTIPSRGQLVVAEVLDEGVSPQRYYKTRQSWYWHLVLRLIHQRASNSRLLLAYAELIRFEFRNLSVTETAGL